MKGRMAALHLFALYLAAVSFSLLPWAASGIPLDRQLSSDAEWYAAAMMRSTDPPQLAPDPSQTLEIRATGEMLLTAALARLGASLGIDLLAFSVAVSIAALLLFITAVYLGVRRASGATVALLVAGASIVSVHALGGATYGFSALGYLPRDLMLAPAIGLVCWWVVSPAERRWRILAAAGVCAWAYPVLFAHLALCLVAAHVIEERRIGRGSILSAAAFAVAAGPAIVDVLGRAGTPTDVEIMRLRMGYHIVDGLLPAIGQYLRRVLVYAVLVAGLALVARPRDATLRSWHAVAVASLALALIGVFAESMRPEAIRYLLSRTAVFFIFAAMVVTATSLMRLPETGFLPMLPRRRALAAGAVILIFAFQSGAVSVTRDVLALQKQSEARRGFHAAVGALARRTAPGDLVAATSEEVPDLAASVRTYARRPVWQTYKDIGVVQVDGARGRRAFERWSKQREALSSGDPDRLLAFMRENGIRAVLIPESALRAPPGPSERVGGFLVIFSD